MGVIGLPTQACGLTDRNESWPRRLALVFACTGSSSVCFLNTWQELETKYWRVKTDTRARHQWLELNRMGVCVCDSNSDSDSDSNREKMVTWQTSSDENSFWFGFVARRAPSDLLWLCLVSIQRRRRLLVSWIKMLAWVESSFAFKASEARRLSLLPIFACDANLTRAPSDWRRIATFDSHSDFVIYFCCSPNWFKF